MGAKKLNNFKDLTDPSIRFTVDAEELTGFAQVPGITQLLNRKKLKKPDPKVPQKSEEKIKNDSRRNNEFTLPGAPIQQPFIKKAAKKPPISSNQLIEWDRALLLSSPDPMAEGILGLLEIGANCGVYLSHVSKPPKGVPPLIATASIFPNEKLPFWNGLGWDPKIHPDIWNQIESKGFVEFSPPETMTLPQSNRNIARTAFGVSQSEWLTLIYVGTKKKNRGIFACTSAHSILADVQRLLHFFQS